MYKTRIFHILNVELSKVLPMSLSSPLLSIYLSETYR